MNAAKDTATAGDGPDVSDVRRRPLWFSSGEHKLWAWLHCARDASAGNGQAVVICNPVGHELIHAYRSIRHLADALARRGFAVLRFDYSGTGDSTGEQLDAGIVTAWQQDVAAALAYCREQCAAEAVHLVGIRSGALLAAAAAADASVPGSLILWDPIASGKRLVRELQANSRLAYFQSAPDMLEAVGFPYSTEMQQQLKVLDLVTSVADVDSPVLLVTREQQPDTRLAAKLGEKTGDVQVLELPGLEEMLIEPHHTIVPHAANAAVANWLAQQDGATANSVPMPNPSPAGEFGMTVESTDILESPVDIGESGMFGIHCRPASDAATERPMVLFGNAGSIYHIGPNRLYVMLARRLAAAGFASIRYDLANIGDGLRFPHLEENRAYPAKAVQYITEVIEYARQQLGHESVILTGFCSGATQAFHAALAQKPTAALIEITMVNPKIFYVQDMPKHANAENLVMRRASYYRRAIRDPERWARLLKGDIDFGQLFGFLRRRMAQLSKRAWRRLLRVFGKGAGTRLGDDLQRFRATGRKLSFFLSSRDPGLTVLLESSGGVARRLIDEGSVPLTIIEDGDHTLIQKRCRDDFMQRFIDHVAETNLR
ncbi:MAG: alpha/beta fold hydrolase [Gammaproteobacteria bacterium]|nr:alpha/beta fold hydrolase [Gammaproteobacteria bacterium]